MDYQCNVCPEAADVLVEMGGDAILLCDKHRKDLDGVIRRLGASERRLDAYEM